MQAIKKTIEISPDMIMITCLIIALSVLQTRAQTIRSLNVSDTLPNIEIVNLVHERAVPLKTKPLYKDGLLIINFWATWCKPCVQEMTFLADEDEKYKERLHVINIGYEPKAVVTAFLKAHPEIDKSNLEITTDDKIWIKMFFHQALPHNVWVNSKGIIKSITGGDEITDENIKSLLNDQPTRMYQKNEVPFDMFKPMPVPDSLIEYRSIFNKHLPGVSLSGEVVDSHGWGRPLMRRFFAYNDRITGMLWAAYQLPGFWTFEGVHNFMEIHTADSSRYFWPGADAKTGKNLKVYQGISQDDWGRANTYSYELRTPKTLPDSIFFNKVISELEFNLGIKTWRELRKINCIIVTLENQKQQFKPVNLSAQSSIIVEKNKIIVSDAPISVFLQWLSERIIFDNTRSVEPYIDQTGLKGPISFTIDLGNDPSGYRSLETIQKCLNEQLGFKFENESRLYPILIIKDL
jgi:thiol-disulfide isomerase/thioredoxin